ncbi:hypothetical protein VPNG_03947 [Cytospora leucostoma]|uniref:Protein yippee-like n=1 Tax=Cytospora leucostoma TaxID=1230097 RepID=A0A423XE43_9PEZI|nr:hypothetical protein VPNG_03947 [Cytospora leucostoma]
MGLQYPEYLDDHPDVFACNHCKAHFAYLKDIISQNFRGQHGKAFLFHRVANFELSEPTERNMTTGRHIVRDVMCKGCHRTVGWKYDKAYETSEKYKEGKFILEQELLVHIKDPSKFCQQ